MSDEISGCKQGVQAVGLQLVHAQHAAKCFLHACARLARRPTLYKVAEESFSPGPVSCQHSQDHRLRKFTWAWLWLIISPFILAHAQTVLPSSSLSAAWSPCRGDHCRQQCATSCECSTSAPNCEHFIAAGTSRCVNVTGQPEQPIFFVHIPKTGGTTLRKIVEQVFGVDRMCYIYRPTSAHTHALVKEYLVTRISHYRPSSVRSFMAVAQKSCSWVGGHVWYEDFAGQVDLRRVLSFVREPGERVVSFYFMVKRHQEAADGKLSKLPQTEMFKQFAVQLLVERNDTAQWKRLQSNAIPPQAFGMVGLTERFDESLKLLNAAFDTNFELQRSENVNTMHARARIDSSDLPPVVQRLMQPDYDLYRLVEDIFEERMRLFKRCKPYVHGAIEDLDRDGVLTGWAWWAHSDEPVRVKILRNGATMDSVVAGRAHRLGRQGAPRHGMVGFQYMLPGGVLTSDVVRVEVEATGQLLGEIATNGTGRLLWRGVVVQEA